MEMRMRRGIFLVLVVGCFFLLASDEVAPLGGYSSASSKTEREWETKFRAIPSPQNLRDYMQRLAARPHHVGSPYDKDNAEWMQAKFKEWGLDAHIESFDVLFPTPKTRVLEMVEPTKFVAKIQEPALAVDPTSSQTAEQLPVYNAYSADGDVTAPLVYVNYGVPDDYEKLDRMGVSVKGAIVIARYGGSWRGIKPKVAAEHGAIGCLIYSDPKDDGYGPDEVFPAGPMRPKDGAQRGSVADMPVYPGDPLTPGVGATKDAKRLALKDATTLTKIPVMPISYGDAQPLLASMKGEVAPEEWRGALPITYRVGPGPTKVHLKLAFNWDLKPLYDVIVKIPGAEQPDQWIVRGNHHDGWVNGAEDPVSGANALMEEARGLSELLKQGWKPKRTIIYCVWDGEEPGLLGSTEWAETHAEELKQHAVVYINSDGNDRGFLNAGGSHTLERFVNGLAKDIEDPEKKITVWQRHHLKGIADADSEDSRKEARSRADWRIDALGSGSDFTPFLQHLGVASLDLSYGGEGDSGIYHSIYDDFYWYTHFADTDFVYGRALSQTIGTAVMRLADADLLPYDFTALADTTHRYLDEVQKLLKTKQDEAAERNAELDEGLFTATADPKRSSVAPPRKDLPPHLNFAPLQNAMDALTRSAERYQKALEKVSANGELKISGDALKSLNETLLQSERKLTSEDGLPRRPWFKHLIYAPGLYTGYGVKTLPGVREAIEIGKWQEADEQIVKASAVIDAEAKLVDSAAQQLEAAVK
jgi:N-acetylated-alpha-linked acidic dipeptidase